MMASLTTLLSACQAESESLREQTRQRLGLWENWLQPLSESLPTGEDPGYDDDFQMMREEVNKLSGANTDLICQLAEKLLTTSAKDFRVATYYCWARLHRDGESGLADGLELLAGLLTRFGTQLHPQRDRSRQAALEWLASARMLDSLSLYPEVVREDALRTAGALVLITDTLSESPEEAQPQLNGLYAALESRLMKAGGVDAIVPQNAAIGTASFSIIRSAAPELSRIASGQDLLAQARTLTTYLREQPDGWLAAHRLMKSLRHDTLQSIPAPDAEGKTRIEPPRADQRALLKRLYLQQNWSEMREVADDTFSRGANHLWLDLQWYTHQALLKSGQDVLAAIIAADLKGLLSRLTGLETLAFNDGSAFADEVTLAWIRQDVMDEMSGWQDASVSITSVADNDVLGLEPEVLEKADNDGLEAALGWLQTRPGLHSTRDKWLMRLLMARVAEQKGKNDMALHLLGELDSGAQSITLMHWTPELMFEIKSRRLRLLRIKATRSEADKARLQPEIDALLSGLIMLDPACAAVLCG